MGCRTRVMGNVYDKDNEIAYRRGNLSFTSINLPRLAIKAKGDIDAFFRGLDQMMDLVVQQLLDRFEIQRHKRVYNYPFLMGQGVGLGSENLRWDEEVGEVLKQGSFSVGFIGLAEALVALIGEHHGQSEKGAEPGLGYCHIYERAHGCRISKERAELYIACNACRRSQRPLCED